jgi:hypothetical protein
MPLISIKLDVDDKTFQAAMQRAAKALGQLDNRPGDFVPSFDVSNLPGALRQISTLQGAIGAFGTMGLPGQFAAIGMQVGEMAWQMGKAGSEALRTEASFDHLAAGVGESGQAMLQAMAEASRGTVSNADLMAAANRALVLGVADSAAEMAALTEAAIIRGRDVGVGATQAVNDLVTGIGRMSPEILDNLGIANASGAFKEYAAELGKTVEQLTEVEKKQALVNSVLASTEGVSLVDDAAASFERMDAALANAQEALGQLFSPAVAAIAQSLADAVNEATDAMTTDKLEAAQANLWHYGEEITTLTERIRALRAFIATMKFVDPAAAAAATQELNFLTAGLETAGAMYNQFAAITGATAIDMEALANGVVQFASAEAQAAPAVEAVTNKLIAQAQAARTAIASVQQSQAAGLRSSLLGMAGDMGGAGALNQYKELNAQLAERTRLMAETFHYSAEQIEFENAAWIANTTSALREQTQALTDVGAAASSAATGGLTTFDQSLSSLQSTVQSLITQSMTLDGITWPGMEGAGGQRQDAINENARRLAAIANEGLTGQDWLGEFAAEAPTTYADLMLKIAEGMNPQAAAQQLMGEFQAGLRPELLDRDMIKERVKQMLLGEASSAALAQELAAELAAEMGVSLPQALGAAQSALGVTPTTLGADGQQTTADPTGQGASAGVAFQTGFITGFAPTAAAVTILTGIAAGFTANQSLIAASGKAVGAAWGANFLTATEGAIPPQLIAILTSLVTPGVWAQIQTNQSLTTPPP